ncbi:hypothetical protein BZG36_01043 [Bifiguratus adelaidae]|uniref:Adenylate kinase isoenzyme 6 homolog n=1 Tax=Bifiguratus adelaidae TaxID=1938954 RepID=A0A261Y6N7_9FUNG|nr:hypothetical protein BZG36_01043 [Bifiguratus adelaidae]
MSDTDSETGDIPQHPPRKIPSILVTGTPGTGKTTTSEMIANATGLEHIDVGKLCKEKNMYESYMEDFDTHVLDEDKLLDELEEVLAPGGKVVDFHTCEVFPERWFDLVIVLRTNNTVLYDRLQTRKYNERKVTENIECEIMQVVLDEAKASYAEEIVIELQSNSVDDMEENVERTRQWVEAFKRNNA